MKVSQERFTGPPIYGNKIESEWAKGMLKCLNFKTQKFSDGAFQKFDENWLLIYDSLRSALFCEEIAMKILMSEIESYWQLNLESCKFDKILIESGHYLLTISKDGFQKRRIKDYAKEAGYVRLDGSDEPNNVQHRLHYLSQLQNNSENKINHFDSLRQKNLNYALIIFAGLFGFCLTLTGESGLKANPLYVSISIPIIMLIFCLVDRNFHKFSHGWRDTKRILTNKIAEVVNDPRSDISFPNYSLKGEKNAEPFSLQPMIYYLLVLSGLLATILFYLYH